MKKVWLYSIVIILVVIVLTTIGGSFYMLDYALMPEEGRSDTTAHYRELFDTYPETRPWVDSLRRKEALRDTFMTMPNGERHHALYVNRGSNKTALIVHGWRDCAIDFLFIGRIYERLFGYNVVLPDLHAHGLSEGDRIQMGWLDRKDVLQWLSVFQTDTMVVHGVSMGAATTIMLSAEPMPKGVKDIRFVEDCGYTSAWDEFEGELKSQFGLPPFPLLYTSSMLCKLRYGWSFKEASAIEQVRRCQRPMLFIHGSSDSFVPTGMVYRLYDAKPSDKELWVTEGVAHAESYLNYKEEYIRKVQRFVSGQVSL
jgi:hypothetical protein